MDIQSKAGMESVDINSINHILNQFSQHTHYQEKLDREEENIKGFIEEMLRKLENLPTDEVYNRTVDEYLSALIRGMDMSRTFIHVDMDAFYANVEEMDNPALKGVPVGVGSMDMLVTSNYVARKFGVRSGIPGMVAMTLCPHLEIVPSRMDRYREVSSLIRDVFYKYDVNYVSPSLDEGTLDITTYLKEHPEATPVSVAFSLQQDILEATSLTCSMGVACSPLLSKLTSEMNKPNGYYYLPSDYEKCIGYLSNVSVRKVPGIGKVRQRLLEVLGVQTVEDILDFKNELFFILPDKYKEIIFKHALGVPIFPSPNLYRMQKKRTMISKEKNCKELYDEQDLKRVMSEIYQFVIEMLKSEGKLALSMIVMIKDYSFKVHNTILPVHPNKGETDLPTIDIDGLVNLDSSSSSISTASDDSTSSPPTSSPPTPSRTNKTQTSPLKLSNKSKYQSLTYEENTEKIWQLFEETLQSHNFVDIRCLGLKLVNLIGIPSPNNNESVDESLGEPISSLNLNDEE